MVTVPVTIGVIEQPSGCPVIDQMVIAIDCVIATPEFALIDPGAERTKDAVFQPDRIIPTIEIPDTVGIGPSGGNGEDKGVRPQPNR